MQKDFNITDKKDIGFLLIIFLPLIGMLIFLPPLSQSQAYHNFIDNHLYFGIPNFHNVTSNIPFLIFALLGLSNYKKHEEKNLAWLLFLIGVLLVAPGSAYYHYHPNNDTLFWDRLPMTIAFMGIVSYAISEQFNINHKNIFTLALVLFGIITVIFWKISDDLRPYYWVQLSAITILFYLSLAFKGSRLKPKYIFMALVFYLLAKFFELRDELTMNLFSYSGHSIKHILASFSVLALLKIKQK